MNYNRVPARGDICGRKRYFDLFIRFDLIPPDIKESDIDRMYPDDVFRMRDNGSDRFPDLISRNGSDPHYRTGGECSDRCIRTDCDLAR